jgi:hypothetical protein
MLHDALLAIKRTMLLLKLQEASALPGKATSKQVTKEAATPAQATRLTTVVADDCTTLVSMMGITASHA